MSDDIPNYFIINRSITTGKSTEQIIFIMNKIARMLNVDKVFFFFTNVELFQEMSQL